MDSRIIIITTHNLVKYPPMQSLLQILIELGRKVSFVGYCSDEQMQLRFEEQGIAFYNLNYTIGNNFVSCWINNRSYRKELRNTLNQLSIGEKDLVIFDYTDSAYFVHDLLESYRYIVLFYEFVNSSRSWKYDLIYSSYNMGQFLQKSVAVIHCEYNRAQITKGLYNLEKLPYVLPNKPYLDDSLLLNEIPDSIKLIISQFKEKVEGKKVLLYQGIFNSNERRLEEFCQAIDFLPDEFVLVAMGGGDSYYEQLKSKYESDRIIFLPFINPPYHLLITQMAHIGILSYFPLDNTFAGVVNPLYCAPNKIFEYSKFSKPMISNDIPGLKYIFGEYKCGEVVLYPFTPQMIKDTVLEISLQYQKYAKGANDYFNSVDIKSIIKDILTDIEY